MFHHKFLLYFCTAPLALASPQSYFHNFGNQGTYTSVSHGVHHQPAPAPYKPPAPAPYKPRAPAYHAQAPSVKSFYNQPVAEPAAYHAPLPKPHVPGVEYDREKCAVDYVEKEAEVCVPTFKTEC